DYHDQIKNERDIKQSYQNIRKELEQAGVTISSELKNIFSDIEQNELTHDLSARAIEQLIKELEALRQHNPEAFKQLDVVQNNFLYSWMEKFLPLQADDEARVRTFTKEFHEEVVACIVKPNSPLAKIADFSTNVDDLFNRLVKAEGRLGVSEIRNFQS